MLPERELKNSLNDRRSFLKLVAAAPLFATIASRSLASTVAAATGRSSSADVYTRLGVRPLINARGNVDISERVTGIAGGAASGRGCIATIC